MSSCKHQNLFLYAPQEEKCRCRHCHLTIKASELGDGYCPECFEAYGVKRYDFDPIQPENEGQTLYGCEECGAVIKG